MEVRSSIHQGLLSVSVSVHFAGSAIPVSLSIAKSASSVALAESLEIWEVGRAVMGDSSGCDLMTL